MDVRNVFQMLADRGRVVLRPPEDRFVRPEEHRSPPPAKRPHLLELRRWLPALEPLLPLVPVPMNRRHQLGRQRIDHRRPHPMQPAAPRITLVREFPARVQRGENDLKRRLLVLGVQVDRNAPPVVRNRQRAAILVQRDDDPIAFLGEILVDRVIDNLPEQVMQTADIDPADVHRRPLPHGLQPFQNLDITRAVRRFPGSRHNTPSPDCFSTDTISPDNPPPGDLRL